jgi:4-amino-4-deoxy-L-arabinose transferase-like glycosyltransferase
MTPTYSERSIATSTFSRPVGSLAIGVIGLAVLATLVLVLVRVGQPYYPVPWLDEGLNWGAVRSLVETGRYGLDSADGFRPFATAIQTGPTVILPAVAAFQAFGPEVWSARLVVGLYAVAAVVAAFALARQLFASTYRALFAVCLLLIGTTEPAASFLPMARQFLGEVPALAFFMGGLSVWLAAIRQGQTGRRLFLLGLAGLFFGFAGLTKSQMALVLGPSLCLLWLADRLFFRQSQPSAFIIPLIGYLAITGFWGVVQFVVLGPEPFAANAELLRETTLMHVLTVETRNWLTALGLLWRTGYLFWGLPTLLWLGYQARRGGLAGLSAMAALALPVTALIWFMFFSIAWGRYAFYPMTLTALFLAGPLGDLWQATTGDGRWSVAFRRSVVVVVAATLAMSSLPPFLTGLANARDDGFQGMRRYLAEQVPADVVVMTWEWPLAIEPEPRLLFPQQQALNRITDYLRSHSAPPPIGDFLPAEPSVQYVLVGPFGGWTGIYEYWIKNHQPVARFGTYALYDLGPVEP